MDKSQKGITLIALVLTVLILIILASVAISAIKNDNLLGAAENQGKEFGELYNTDANYLNNYKENLKNQLKPTQPSTPTQIWIDNGDGTFTKGNITVKIGEYVNYSYDTVSSSYKLEEEYSGFESNQYIPQTKDLQWRVLGVSNGKLELISASAADAGRALWNDGINYSGYIFFQYAKGYNNVVYLLNDMCKGLYSNSTLGVTARSLTIDDIEKRYTENAINYRNSYTSWIQYGKTKTCSLSDGSYLTGASTLEYPSLYAQEQNSGVNGSIREGGIGLSDPYFTSKESLSTDNNNSLNYPDGDLIVTQTAYAWSWTGDGLASQKYFDNSDFEKLIFGGGSYFLASRAVSCSNIAQFCVFVVSGSALKFTTIVYSGGGTNGNYWDYRYGLRPVVTLENDIIVSGSGENIGTADNMWKLTKGQ